MNQKIPVLVDPDDIQKPTADNRGRVNLGTDYSGETVMVAVLAGGIPSGADPEERATCPNDCGPLTVVSDDDGKRRIKCPRCGYNGGSPDA